jgi:hypothetical protein
MRLALQSERKDVIKALMACLLVFCFESMEGNQLLASTYTSELSIYFIDGKLNSATQQHGYFLGRHNLA